MNKTKQNYLCRKLHIFGSFVATIAAFGSIDYVIAQDDSDEDEIFELSPFVIDGSGDNGYAATETLAGTRLRTNIREVGASITIMTPEFLEDLAATSFEEALIYSPNTDTFDSGAINNPDGSSTREANLYSVRGFRTSSISRDFFRVLYRPDTYNTDRLTFTRGPNSILFGIGQPGGVSNSSAKRAQFGEVKEIRARVDDFGGFRASIDLNQTVIDEKLAVRFAALYNDVRYWREPEHEKGERYYSAVKWAPFAGGADRLSDLEINLNYENGETDSMRLGRNEPIYDRVTPWIEAGSQLSDLVGNFNNNASGPDGTRRGSNTPTIAVVVGDTVEVPNLSWRRMGVGNLPPVDTTDQSNNRSLLDESLMPFDVNYYGGSRRYNDDFENFQISLNKQLFEDLNLEFAYNYQNYNRVSFEEIRGPALEVDVNRFLPNGDANPNAGRYYLDTPLVRNQPFGRNRLNSYRLSASYEYDFSRFDGWSKKLGKVRLASSFEAEDDKLDRQWIALTNVTPALTNERLGLAGPARFPTNIRHARNRAKFRAYVDPVTGVGAAPPASEAYPNIIYGGDAIPDDIADENGVSLAFTADFPGFNTLTESRSLTGAIQHYLFDERLITTFGWRQDRQDSYNAAELIAGDADPVAGLYPDPRGYDPKDAEVVSREGEPTTLSVVGYPLDWLGVFYNESENFVPRGQIFDINGDVLDNQSGDGEDYGLKFFLFDSKLIASVAWFETVQVNEATGFIRAGARGTANQFDETQARIWDEVHAITGDDKYLDSPYTFSVTQSWNALQDSTSEGVEFQLVYNPTQQLRVSFNYSEQESVYNNIGPKFVPYFTDFVPNEITAAGIDLDTPLQETYSDYKWGIPVTLGDLLDATALDIDRIQSLLGSTDSRQPLESANLVATYNFAEDSRLKGFSVGGTVLWRGDRNIGFADTDEGLVDTNNPFFGGSQTTVDAMLRYRKKIGNGVRWTAQVNIKNIFDETDLLPLQIDSEGVGNIARWGFRTPRSVLFSNTFSF